MKILEKDLKRGVVTVRVEDDSDLWLLHTIISRGDLVRARTTREVRVGGEEGGSKARIPMVLTIKVEYTEFQPFTGRLRIHGIIVEGPEKYGLKGSHHTIAVNVDSELTIFKEEWQKTVVKKLMSAKPRSGKVGIVAIDYDEISLGILYNYGIKQAFTRELRIPGKDSPLREEVLNREIEETARYIIDNILSENVELVVVGGPGFLKEKLASILNEMLEGKIRVEAVQSSSGGVKGVNEIVKRSEFRKIVRDIWAIEEVRSLEEFLKLLAKNPRRVAYGLEYVLKAAKLGAVDKVLVLDEMLKSYDEEVRRVVEEILDEAEKYGGRIVIFSSHGPAREELRSLGGIAAILRFNVES